jgi:hypothetical protein
MEFDKDNKEFTNLENTLKSIAYKDYNELIRMIPFLLF